MADDDDDDVALEEGQETGGDDDDAGAANEPRVAAGGAVSAVIPVRKGTRPISDKVREVFLASMAKMKSKGDGEDEGGLEPLEHEDAPAEPAPVVKPDGADVAALGTAQPAAPVTPPAVAAPPPAPVAPPPAAAPPAPSLDPEVMRMRTELEQQRKDFETERAKFLEQSRTSDVAKLRDTYFDKGAPAVVEIVKQWMPGIEGEELKREVADLIQDLAYQYLDAPLDETVKDRITNKRVRAGLKTWKQEQERLEQERLAQLRASQEEQQRLQVKKILHQEVTKPDHATQYPYLAAEENAGDLVYEIIDTQYRKDGTQLTWVDAAKRANDWLEQQARAYFDKRKHLLSPQPPAPQEPAPSDKQRAQGDTQVSRSHAQQPPKKPPPQPERPVTKSGKWDPEQHRRSVMQKFKASLPRFADDE